MSELTHFDHSGASRMVDVGPKPETHRQAVASALVKMQPATVELLRNRALSKGDVIEVARLAGIMAAKKTADLIPLCHSLPLTSVDIDFTYLDTDTMRIQASVTVFARTGVEMEALTAVSVAALTVYDMAKAMDRGMKILNIQLEAKSGGRSGSFTRGSEGAGSRTTG